ncbi:hypothetical protein STCU_11612 [Strigomonas culicis]|uniref:Uncharacterized protein n=1 Tax=Strigomonas culicis TaxID=28005 RepID=S9TI38_9TRYP|nr:hypothetical protein STCU_11612 [Strigomonas culicis]|eukprot:EPY16008.1 hypothetical protein STCU_11612 [Strigomonas culicis]
MSGTPQNHSGDASPLATSLTAIANLVSTEDAGSPSEGHASYNVSVSVLSQWKRDVQAALHGGRAASDAPLRPTSLCCVYSEAKQAWHCGPPAACGAAAGLHPSRAAAYTAPSSAASDISFTVDHETHMDFSASEAEDDDATSSHSSTATWNEQRGVPPHTPAAGTASSPRRVSCHPPFNHHGWEPVLPLHSASVPTMQVPHPPGGVPPRCSRRSSSADGKTPGGEMLPVPLLTAVEVDTGGASCFLSMEVLRAHAKRQENLYRALPDSLSPPFTP